MNEEPLNPVHRLFNVGWIRKALVRIRFPIGLALAVWLAWNIRPEWFWPGLAVSALGELFQVWCFSSLHKQRTLATNGPYKVVRNPMYLARYFLFLGCLMWLGNPYVLAGFTLLYYFYMVNRVRREEAKLRDIFGEPYLAYCRKVHRFIPFAGVNPEGEFFYFRGAYFLENNAHWNALAQVAYYILAYVLTFVWRGA